MHRESFKVTGLAEAEQYYFRVLAVNKYGVGEPAETREVAKTCEVPGAPKSINIVEMTSHTATLKWTKPESEGGSAILSYTVEMQRVGMDTWVTKATTSSLE